MAERLLSVGMIGDDVAALHETLLQQGLKIPESETGRGFFGPATRKRRVGDPRSQSAGGNRTCRYDDCRGVARETDRHGVSNSGRRNTC